MNIKSAIIESSKILNSKEIESADLEAEIFLSYVLRRPREFILAHPEMELNYQQTWRMNRLVRQRTRGVPVAYLIGHKEFYGLDFLVNKNVLIPRPETELIVDEVIDLIKKEKIKNKKAIDVGTGSGCIICSLAKNLKDDIIEFYGLDISKKALAVARKNAQKNGVDDCIHFLYGDLLNVTDKTIFAEPVIITANLPYLTIDQVKNSPTIQKEPRIALLSGVDGLDHYRRLFGQINECGIENKAVIFCEINETQKDLMAGLIKQEFPKANLEFKNDLGGYCRLAVIKL